MATVAMVLWAKVYYLVVGGQLICPSRMFIITAEKHNIHFGMVLGIKVVYTFDYA